MSDPVTNVQIEDVLSSIRKLVSEEVRAQTRQGRDAAPRSTPEDHRAAEPEQPKPVDKLVLTPALRVHDPEDMADEGEAGSALDLSAFQEDEFDESPFPPEVLTESDEAEPVATTGRDRNAGDDADVDGAFDMASFNDWLQDADKDDDAAGGAHQSDYARDSDALMRELAAAEAEDDDLGYEDEGGNVAGPVLGSYDPRNDDIGEEEGAQLDPADFEEEPDEEALADDDDAMTPEEAAPEPAFLHREPRPDSPIPSFLRSRGVLSLEERIAGLERGAGQASADLSAAGAQDADTALAGDAASEALLWEDHLDPADDDEVADLLDDDQPGIGPADDELDHGTFQTSAGAGWQHSTTSRTEPDRNEFYDDAPMIDEEALRDMVAEIVRQELQGALGERITRNVRKLVRREIQRALTAHDLL
ncbi:hypothetical protein [Oceanicola sp. 22II-s10i]|uniref:hypothetical protein n=1 Tax=Oceanicola sp. 22II-s10i TaxID=1317116 RepID=UPI000B51FF7C|nr:hypothetical protein [Oceanicola sp. 22II-s10i]